VPDEKTKDDLEQSEGAPLPAREMMSLISTDPADGMLGGIATQRPPIEPITESTQPMPTDGAQTGGPYAEPGSGDVMHTQGDASGSEGGSTTSDPRSETITQSDSASADS
jgi:hypothetical protein